MVYAYKPKAHIRTPAQVAGEVCEELAKIDGGLTPKRLLDASRAPEAPLHDEFEWQDDVAAEKYREGQARHIISCITVVTEDTASDAKPVRAFVNIREEEHSSYVPLETVIRTPSMREKMLADAVNDLRVFRAKYEQLDELVTVFSAVNGFLTSTEVSP